MEGPDGRAVGALLPPRCSFPQRNQTRQKRPAEEASIQLFLAAVDDADELTSSIVPPLPPEPLFWFVFGFDGDGDAEEEDADDAEFCVGVMVVCTSMISVVVASVLALLEIAAASEELSATWEDDEAEEELDAL